METASSAADGPMPRARGLAGRMKYALCRRCFASSWLIRIWVLGRTTIERCGLRWPLMVRLSSTVCLQSSLAGLKSCQSIKLKY